MSGLHLDHLALLQETTTRFAALVRESSGDEAVPACHPWRVRDLVEHVGTVHRWAASIVLSGQRVADPRPLVTGDPADWYAGTAAALLAALRAVDPGEQVPNFSRLDETAAFWPRRQLHEVTVHVVDLLQAMGRDESQWDVPAELAADGVGEVLRIFFPRMSAGGSAPDVRSRIRLVADDLDLSWVVAPTDDAGPPVQLPATAEADAVVTGSAADLYLALWHRVPRERLRFEGDDGVALFDGPTTP
ncbi:maleylpyruvate isomerase family mycothiol-dependent enzyme [Aeromicrobium endophyticum]|uniref:Maleylpyruvate isomerase family mycothiol-dependent enzyme n=1 Tax=Aeromicrobium endophyticum TaxID=2292704 RepID=A0A371P8Y8_9ACTN|nr:maleylpyruvate isomerase family mycothiol-dependent enzyme [Aeromicrobium endophyticum]REK72407.1 maleylpyruvate isomerase family mycothiol-dependent enzyme [Aeromicrobium endophyticum]